MIALEPLQLVACGAVEAQALRLTAQLDLIGTRHLSADVGALDDQGLLYANEDIKPSTLGFWRFETKTGTMRDSSGQSRDLTFGAAKAVAAPAAAKAAHAPLAALCHALLNSSEFLYVE